MVEGGCCWPTGLARNVGVCRALTQKERVGQGVTVCSARLNHQGTKESDCARRSDDGGGKRKATEAVGRERCLLDLQRSTPSACPSNCHSRHRTETASASLGTSIQLRLSHHLCVSQAVLNTNEHSTKPANVLSYRQDAVACPPRTVQYETTLDSCAALIVAKAHRDRAGRASC